MIRVKGNEKRGEEMLERSRACVAEELTPYTLAIA